MHYNNRCSRIFGKAPGVFYGGGHPPPPEAGRWRREARDIESTATLQLLQGKVGRDAVEQSYTLDIRRRIISTDGEDLCIDNESARGTC